MPGLWEISVFLCFLSECNKKINETFRGTINLKKINSKNLQCTLLSKRDVSLETWQLPADVETLVNPWRQSCQQSMTTRWISNMGQSPPSQASPATGYRKCKVLGQLHSLGFPWAEQHRRSVNGSPVVLGIYESENLECLKVPRINILVAGSLEAWENPFWSQHAQGFQVTFVGSRSRPWASTELPRFSLCWLLGKKSVEIWHKRALPWSYD